MFRGTLKQESTRPNFVLFVFRFLLLSLSICDKWKKCIYYDMAKLNNEKRKNFALLIKHVSRHFKTGLN